MARLFTAIELASGARRAVSACQSGLAALLSRPGDDSLRLVRQEHLHLTLVFIGDVDQARVPEIQTTMSADIGLPPFEVELASCGVFPPDGPPRVLWLGVGLGHAQLVKLFGLVSRRLEQVGVHPERRPFAPHLTIGRWRTHSGGRRPFLPDVGTVAVQPVSRVTLFESRLAAPGPTHTALATARLSGVDLSH